MRLEYVRQVPPGDPPHQLIYGVDGDKLTVAYKMGDAEAVDTFDFTGTPDGEVDVDTIETALPVQPILAARRDAGALTVAVLDWRL